MPVSRRELLKKFRALGFNGPYSGGRRQFMAKGDLKVRIPNPHQKGEIFDSLLNEILRQAETSKEQWEKL